MVYYSELPRRHINIKNDRRGLRMPVNKSALFPSVLVVLFTSIIPGGPAALAANQSEIVAAMGAGWNLGNQLEANFDGSAGETYWGNPEISPTLIAAVKDAGFSTIRIPVSYLDKIGPAPDYAIDSAWLARIKEVVDYAYGLDMHAIINIHGDGYTTVTGAWLLVNSTDQTAIKTKYQKVWQQIASAFVDYDERLIFESMNEVFDGTWSAPASAYYANLNEYNQIFVNTVRQTGSNNSTRWLLIPGWNTNIDYTAGDYGFVIPSDDYRSSSIPSSEKRLMISVHYYSPWDFCGEESGTITQWGATAANSSKKSTWGQEEYMDSQLKAMRDRFVSQGYPVVVGEFGSIDKTGADATNNLYRARFAQTLSAYSKKYGAVPVVWDNGYNGPYGFGLFDRATHSVTQQGIIDAIMDGLAATTTRSAFSPIEAESFDAQSGIQAETCSEGGQDIGYIQNGDYAVYHGVDFGENASRFEARVASATSGGKIEIRLGGLAGPLAGTCAVAWTGGWQNWTTVTCNVGGATGIHDLYLKFTGGGGYLFNLNWFRFIRAGTAYEAESGTLLTQSTVESNHAGFTGGGFVNFNASTGAAVQWNGIYSSAAETKNLKFRYALAAGTRYLDIYVNGTRVVRNAAFGATGGWAAWGERTIQVPMNSGNNTLELVTTGTEGPNVDNVNVSAAQ
jgi:endoglucanase